MAPTAETPQNLSPDDTLPAVEPPSAGFILQLFVVPAVIVAIIVAVWLMFNWLAHMGDDPQSYVKALSRDNAARWQAAVNLANALRRPNNKLRGDKQLAQQLSQALEEELQNGKQQFNENEIKLRVYLCRTLGEFEVADGLPVLLKATTLNRNEAEIPVRWSAIEAIALLASGSAGDQVRQNAEVTPVLLTCSRDDDVAIRSRAAFALGVIGGQAAQDRLVQMLADPVPDVRYNAATGLARSGDAKAIDVLVEMLDPERVQLVESKDNPLAQEFKRATVSANALKAAQKLIHANATADLSPLKAAAERLEKSTKDQRIRAYVAELIKAIDRRDADKRSACRQSDQRHVAKLAFVRLGSEDC